MPNQPTTFSPANSYEEALERAALAWGVECEYWDIWGKQHKATAEGMSAVLDSVGVDVRSKESLDSAVENRLWRDWSRVLPPTVVTSSETPEIRVRVPANDAAGLLDMSVAFEDGGSEKIPIALDAIPRGSTAELRGTQFVEKAVSLPQLRGRLGYHRLRYKDSDTRLIVGPDRAYFPHAIAHNGRTAGMAVSLYGVRSARNWGCGDFTDLRHLIDWSVDSLGLSFIGLNPLHAIPNRQPYNTSPYLPACSFYRNLIYLDIQSIPEFQNSKCAQTIAKTEAIRNEAARLRDAQFVEYASVAALKQRFLKLLFREFLKDYRAHGTRAAAFKDYVQSEGALLDDYAVYSALDEIMHRRDPNVWLWTDWPKQYQNPRSAETREFAQSHWRTVLFFKYVQWQIDEQLNAAQEYAKQRGMAIGLYHDLALATDRFGSDLWAHREFYVNGCRVGSPPDDFSPSGQDWSFPPPNSDVHFEDGYRLFVESIRKNLRHGGALRIDHVMRFFHLFWIPDRLDPKRGIYVRDRHEDLIRILALESVRNQVLIVGEDLGTVVDEIRETLHRFGILSYRLFYFEKSSDGRFRLPHDYPKQALVSISTHDLPTLAGFWEARDIDARRKVGMCRDEADYHRQVAERQVDKQRMLDALFSLGLMPKGLSRTASDYPELTGDLHNAAVGFVATTPSTLMLLNEEDLMKQRDQQNLPGTCEQYPNWRHKTRFTVEELKGAQAEAFAEMYKGWLNVTGRLSS